MNAFSPMFLKDVLAEVRAIVPKPEIKKAWVWTSDRRTWEFHFGEFYDYFHASDAYEAYAKGWEAWLRRRHDA